MRQRLARKLRLVGWDAADWKVITPSTHSPYTRSPVDVFFQLAEENRAQFCRAPQRFLPLA
jgi:hypothetical protein